HPSFAVSNVIGETLDLTAHGRAVHQVVDIVVGPLLRRHAVRINHLRLHPGRIVFKLIWVVVAVYYLRKQTRRMAAVGGIAGKWVILELREYADARVLWHGVASQPIHAIVGFRLGGAVRANYPCDVDIVVVVKLR